MSVSDLDGLGGNEVSISDEEIELYKKNVALLYLKLQSEHLLPVSVSYFRYMYIRCTVYASQNCIFTSFALSRQQ